MGTGMSRADPVDWKMNANVTLSSLLSEDSYEGSKCHIQKRLFVRARACVWVRACVCVCARVCMCMCVCDCVRLHYSTLLPG